MMMKQSVLFHVSYSNKLAFDSCLPHCMLRLQPAPCTRSPAVGEKADRTAYDVGIAADQSATVYSRGQLAGHGYYGNSDAEYMAARLLTICF